MKSTRSGLTVFFIVLTLSIGVTSMSSMPSASFSSAQALDEKINNSIMKACTSSEANLNNIKNGLRDGVKSCLSKLTNKLPSNGDTVLVTITHLRANNCNSVIPKCPVPNGVINIVDSTTGKTIATYVPSENSNNPVPLYNAIPVGHEVKIFAQKDPKLDSSFYQYELANIVNINDGCSASGEFAVCTIGAIGSQGATVEVNWHYKCVSRFCGS